MHCNVVFIVLYSVVVYYIVRWENRVVGRDCRLWVKSREVGAGIVLYCMTLYCRVYCIVQFYIVVLYCIVRGRWRRVVVMEVLPHTLPPIYLPLQFNVLQYKITHYSTVYCNTIQDNACQYQTTLYNTKYNSW